MRDATRIEVFFNGDSTLFLIPLYQRKYAWQDKHCRRLYTDLEKIIKKDLPSHFFGTIVTTRANEVDDDLLIIDGQQRVTTLSLLILAAVHAVAEGEMVCENEKFLEAKKTQFIMAQFRKGSRQIKLCPIDQDRTAYDAIVNNDIDTIEKEKNSEIVKNYRLFRTLIKVSELTFDDLIAAIQKLIIIDIRLESKDNPQLIFESLNSCGKDLEESDKVRNFLLMDLTAEQQSDFYHKYWKKIEDATGKNLTMFIRDYLTLKRKLTSNLSELYFDFKAHVEANEFDREALLSDMLKFAKLYKKALEGVGASKKLSRKFRQLANIGSTVCMPFYMAFLDYAEQENLSDDEIYKVLDVVEGYWARRIICSYPANVMTKLFSILHSDVLRLINSYKERNIELPVSYVEVLKYVLLKKQGYSVFPHDQEVEVCFPTRQIYKLPIDYRYFLFERMENENSDERKEDVVEKMKKGDYTIEHIMPQTLSADWKRMLGEKWEEVYEKYIHTFANLTLTAYNSNYSNRPFAEKKTGYIDKEGNKVYGYNEAGFRLSEYLKSCDKWTESEMIERQKILIKRFFDLWPMIDTKFEPLEKESEIVSLADEDYDFTGRTIIGFKYKGEDHEATSWKSMIEQVCKLVYDEKPTEMGYLASKDFWFHNNDLGKDGSKIADNCYVYTATSTRSKMSTLRYLFSNLEMPNTVLEIKMAPIEE